MTVISNKIDEIFLLPLTEKDLLLSLFERVEAKKGEILINADKIEHQIYFIEKGIARAYVDAAKGQTTIWFGEEGDIILSYLSFFKDKPGYESIELLENSILYRISSKAIKTLFSQNIQLANWGRKFLEQELLKTEERFMSLQFKTATERYKDLMAQHPSILQRVPLGHIASYLGITQVSLSRIRAKS